MTILHILSKSLPETTSLLHHIETLGEGHELLITANGAYMLAPGSPSYVLLTQASLNHGLYVLAEDLLARGLHAERLDPGFNLIDYAAFVALVAKHSANYRWS